MRIENVITCTFLNFFSRRFGQIPLSELCLKRGLKFVLKHERWKLAAYST